MAELLAALAGAVVGAAVAGVATALAANWAARRQLRRESRIRLYLEVVPSLEGDVTRRWSMVNDGKPPPRLDTLLEHFLLLRRVAAVASKEDRERVEQLRPLLDDLIGIDRALWGPDRTTHGVVPDELLHLAMSQKEPLNELSKALYSYGEWLSVHLD